VHERVFNIECSYVWNNGDEAGGLYHWGELGLYGAGGYLVRLPSNDSILANAIVETIFV
jgi:hypothetical protein